MKFAGSLEESTVNRESIANEKTSWDVRSRSNVSERVITWKAIVLAGGLDVVGLEDCPATLGVNVDGGRKGDEEGEDEKEVD